MIAEDFLQDYVEEVKEHLQELENSLLVLEREGTNTEEINQIFRAAHSIKGASAYMGFERLASLTHELESLISEIQMQSRPVSAKGISILLRCVDFITNAVSVLQEKGEEPPLPPGLLKDLRDSFAISAAREEATSNSAAMGFTAGTEAHEASSPAATSEDPVVPERPTEEEETAGPLEGVDTSAGVQFTRPAPTPLEKVDMALEAATDALPVSEETADANGDEIQEEDQELFNIFLTSFQEQYAELASIVGSAVDAGLTEAEFQNARTLLKRLIASSQYMDYDQIIDVLEECEQALAAESQAGAGDKKAIASRFQRFGQRLQKILPQLRLPAGVPSAEAAGEPEELPEEEDQELFAIFLDACQQQYAELAKITPEDPRSVISEEDFAKARECIRRMIASSRYMDYDPIVTTLGEWDTALSAGQQNGAMDGACYGQLLDSYGQRLQQIMAGFIAPSPEAAAAEDMAFEMLDQEIDASFDEFEKLATPGEPALQDLSATSTRLVQELKPEGGMPETGVQEFPSPALDQRTAGKPRIATASEESPVAVTLRVDAQKVDQLLNQVGELVVTRSEFIQTAMSFRDMVRELSTQGKLSKQEVRKLRQLNFRLNESTQSLGRVASDLQDSVMRIRMLPISQLFQRFPRVVRDQAFKLDKKAELLIEGGETEIDKRVLEQMNDPIVQFLRNAIVHGIEPPMERKLAGKPETGTIRMAAYHEGDCVILEIEDDGRGIDTEKLRHTLESRREMNAQELDRLSDQELMYAIFLPGISTHDRVDGSAGRGVGLDVVKENVERMGGAIEVESYAGIGTRFTVRIPLTVAIIRALLVKGAGQVFTLPLSSVSEILRYKQAHTHTIEGFQVITLRGETIPLVHLSHLLNMPAKSCENGHKFIVVVATSFREVGLVVDGLIGEREVVIKSIEDDFHAFEGFSGATILGDGTVSLIVDLSALLRVRKDAVQQQQRAPERYIH